MHSTGRLLLLVTPATRTCRNRNFGLLRVISVSVCFVGGAFAPGSATVSRSVGRSLSSDV
jgi:hypothetical protein